MVGVVLRRILRRVLARRPSRGRGLVIGGIFVLALLGAGLFVGLPRLMPGSASLASASEMMVTGLEANPLNGQTVLVLKEKTGARRLAMVVGQSEARTISDELQGVRSERPMPYDLMRELVQRLGGRISHVLVNHVTETNLYAKVVVASEGRDVEVDARPSDAIALALRVKAPIFVDSKVLEKAGIGAAN